jgi:hypothetical protein
LDKTPLPCLPISVGTWKLRYEFFAVDFPVLQIVIELTIPTDWKSTAQVISQEMV